MSMSSALSLSKEGLAQSCRCCLTKTNSLKPLFGASLDEMFYYFISIRVQEGDGYPNQICTSCILKLSSAFTFRLTVLKSQEIITQFLQNEKAKEMDGLQNENPPDLMDRIIMGNTILNNRVDLEKESVNNYIHENDDVSDTSNIHDNVGICQEDLLEMSDHEVENIWEDSLETVNETISCIYCSEVFTNKMDRKVHLSTHKDTCSICNKIVPKTGLRRHMNTHTRPYACGVCNVSFGDITNLSRHNKAKHTAIAFASRRKEHLCYYCGKKFKWRSSLQKHIRFHTGRNLISCTHCKKQFVDRAILDLHMMRHSAEKQFKCESCNRRFKHLCSLRKHSKLHKEKDS